MTANSNEAATWPMPKFNFEVDFGTELKNISFQEVSGMEVEHQVIEYRHSNSALFSTQKMPGISKYGNVTMKLGVFVDNETFWNWYDQVQMGTIPRQTILIKLLDEGGNVTMQWQLNNAWPSKVIGADLKSEGNEVAVDTVEIAHEQLVITNS